MPVNGEAIKLAVGAMPATVTVSVSLGLIILPIDAVMNEVPADIPVASPVDEFMVATEVLADDHVTDEVIFAVELSV